MIENFPTYLEYTLIIFQKSIINLQISFNSNFTEERIIIFILIEIWTKVKTKRWNHAYRKVKISFININKQFANAVHDADVGKLFASIGSHRCSWTIVGSRNARGLVEDSLTTTHCSDILLDYACNTPTHRQRTRPQSPRGQTIHPRWKRCCIDTFPPPLLLLLLLFFSFENCCRRCL